MKQGLAAILLVACGSPQAPSPAPTPTVPVVIAPVDAGAPIAIASGAPVVKSTPLAGECTGTAVVVALDKSGSMSGVPLERAERGMEDMIDALKENDCFGLVAFDSIATPVVKLGLVGDKKPIADAMRAVKAGGGTEILAGLKAAHEMIHRANRTKSRLVILLTDGQSPMEGILERVKEMVDDSITVSVIGLGGGVDVHSLVRISKEGGGRLYPLANSDKLRDAFSRELELFEKPDAGY